jgi:hypothetical protein
MFFKVNNFEIVLRMFDICQQPKSGKIHCGDELATFRNWIDRTMNQHHASARSFDIRLGRITQEVRSDE